MQTPKKDWTQQERDRFERMFCALITYQNQHGLRQNLSDAIKDTHEYIEALDNHYQNTSNEQSTNNN